MTKQKRHYVNWLEHNLPEGLLVDAAWLTRQGYSTSLRAQYVAAGWLTQPARRVYQRPRGSLAWQQVVISLQTLLAQDPSLVAAPRSNCTVLPTTSHRQQRPCSFTAPRLRRRGWQTCLKALPTTIDGTHELFRKFRVATAPHSLDAVLDGRTQRPDGIVVLPWGQWNWPLMVSSPERAILEFLDELPDNESFHRPTC